MQKRAGILYLSTDTQRILLILENEKWSVPTFARKTSVIDDSLALQEDFSKGKIVPPWGITKSDNLDEIKKLVKSSSTAKF